MSTEIELVSDGDGLAVFGTSSDVELFLQSEGLATTAKALPTRREVLNAGSAIAQAGSEIAAQSGKWVKLTNESAAAVKKYGLMDTKTPGVSHAMVGQPGDIKQWIQIVKTPGSMVTNPALLAGAAGAMSQLAMQQQMSEIADYLARIDQKLDAVLRMQTNQVLARLDGIDLAVREATTVKASVGRVSDVTWSKVQASSGTILETQGLALRQLADLADKIEATAGIGELADLAKEAEADARKWLTVLARCFQLHDAVAVLELDRVMDSSPDELDRHRMGLKAAREDRLELIAGTTYDLLRRMSVAVDRANSKVLLHPTASPAVVASRNQVANEMSDFHGLLGIEPGHESSEAKRWSEAAGESWDKARTTTADGLGAIKDFGAGAVGQVGSAASKLTGKLSGRWPRRGESKGEEGGTGAP